MEENRGMGDLIGTINKLQDVFASISGGQQSLDIKLPQIVVVGSQSAGKSSVLEHFVGKDFLPRGTGVVTRRPLILQLVQHKSDDEYAVFLHQPNERYTDFEKVKREIEADTNKVCGDRKEIRNEEIVLKVYSPNVLDLTLVDLPGMTKIPVGNQPTNIEEQVKDIIESYIQDENTLILAVSAANVDLTNSDGLNFAKRFDPEGQRTIGVITKLDLMDEGTNALDIFEGRLLKLRLGYVGIVNRSQKDIDSRKSIADAIQSEADWFRTDPKAMPYRHIIHRMGTKYLQKILHEQLSKHIKEKLPGIQRSLQKKIKELNRTLQDYGQDGQDGSDENQSKSSQIYQLLNRFIRKLESEIEGRSLDVSIRNVSPGAAINRTIYGEVYEFINEALKQPNENEIGMALVNLPGYRNSIFPDQDAFDIAVRHLVENYRGGLVSSLETIKNLFINCVETIARDLLGTYPSLLNRVLCLVNDSLLKNEDTTTHHLMAFVDAQKAFMNTKHPMFLSSIRKLEEENDSFGRIDLAILLESNTYDDRDQQDVDEVHVEQNGLVTLLPSEIEANMEINGRTLLFSHTNNQDDASRKSFQLDGCVCKTFPDGATRRFVLQRTDPEEPLYGSTKKLEFLAQPVDLNSWTQAFTRIGILLRNSNPSGMVARTRARNFEQELNSDQVIRKRTDIMVQMVKKYMEVVHASMLDMVPKYLVLSLLKATLKYTQEKLASDILTMGITEEEIDNLVDISAEDKRRIDMVKASKNSFEEALEIVSEMFD